MPIKEEMKKELADLNTTILITMGIFSLLNVRLAPKIDAIAKLKLPTECGTSATDVFMSEVFEKLFHESRLALIESLEDGEKYLREVADTLKQAIVKLKNQEADHE